MSSKRALDLLDAGICRTGYRPAFNRRFEPSVFSPTSFPSTPICPRMNSQRVTMSRVNQAPDAFAPELAQTTEFRPLIKSKSIKSLEVSRILPEQKSATYQVSPSALNSPNHRIQVPVKFHSNFPSTTRRKQMTRNQQK